MTPMPNLERGPGSVNKSGNPNLEKLTLNHPFRPLADEASHEGETFRGNA